jgi:hypothetical protein
MRKYIPILLFFVMSNASLVAADLDGTSNLSYQDTSFDFGSGGYARGFVWIGAGCQANAGATVIMNVLAPVAGNINLNNTGIISLEGDLPLASNAYFINGGVIDGQGKVISLGGNFTIPRGKTIECTSDTIIDGQGKIFSFASQSGSTPGGRLYINGPTGTRVTLRNMHIYGVRSFSNGDAAIDFGSNAGQTLVLENVTLHMSNDYIFVGGKLEIGGRVELRGLYKSSFRPESERAWFYYTSSENCTIKANATLFVDMTVGFSYSPADNKKTHLVFSDASSELFLNGSTLFVPSNTGLHFLKGHMVVDHRTQIQSDGVVRVDGASEEIQFGDGVSSSNDFIVDVLPGARLEVVDALVVYKNHK